MRARRLPCLTHTQTRPEEAGDAATRRLCLTLTATGVLFSWINHACDCKVRQVRL